MRGRALLLVVLMLLPAAAAEGGFQLFYNERASRFAAEGVAGVGETRGYRFVVAQQNVTRVEFVLTWTETGDRTGFSGPDTFVLTAEDPSGRALEGPSARSASGVARLEARDVNPLPPDGPVAADEVDARLEATTGRRGQGEWRAWVRLEDAGNPQGAQVDTENAFQLVAIIHHYDGVAMRVVSLGKPAPGAAVGDVLDDAPLPWLVGLALLAVAACGLGVGLAAQAWRRRRRLSPDGNNATTAGR